MKKVLAAIVLFSTNTQAQWEPNGIPVCDTSANSGFYMLPQIASDGNGGAFVCWRDGRRGEFDIYMQRIYSNGIVQFPHNGISLCDAPYSQQFPRMVSNGRGGTYIAWEDDRSMTQTHVYVQRINSFGQALWTVNGVRAADIGGLFISLALEPISEGVLLGWSTVADAFVQRLDSVGNRMWGDSGVQVTNRPGNVRAGDVAVATDGNDGIIVVWAEGSSGNYSVYAQRVDSRGSAQWVSNGVFLGSGGGVTISSAGGGEVIVTWVDNLNTYIQKISVSGQALWGTSGILVGPGGGRHAIDELGGAFVWHGNQVQHVSASGVALWDSTGVNYTIGPLPTSSTGLGDRNSRAWIFWSALGGNALDIFGQYIEEGGFVRWNPVGVLISSGGQLQDFPRCAPSTYGTAILVWDDFRNGHSNVYAAIADTSGVITAIKERDDLKPNEIRLDQNFPNPFNPRTKIRYAISQANHVELAVYDVLGRRIAILVSKHQEAGRHQVQFSGGSFPSGVYFYRLTTDQSSLVKKMILIR